MFRRFPPVAIAILCGALIAGCMTNRAPRFDREDGEFTQFRRYTGRPAVDYIFRWDEKAFEKVDYDLDGPLSEDQIEVMERRGRPDYLRENVKAVRNETFAEWVYWDQGVIVQFIQGEHVYEGDMVDSDEWLITYGYPTKAYIQDYEYGPVREIWLYEGLLEVGGRSASFSDGQLVFKGIY